MAKTLAELRVGACAEISSIALPPKLQRRLQEMGLVEGTSVSVVRKAPLGDPVEIEVRGYHLALRLSDARHIFVS